MSTDSLEEVLSTETKEDGFFDKISFTFSDVAEGLENGLEKVSSLAKAVEDNKEPIKAGIDLFKMIVDSKKDGVSINNDDVINLLETIAKSTGNDLDDKILNTVKIALKFKF